MFIDSNNLITPLPGSMVQILYCARVPMRDGILLSAMVYRPRLTNALPVVLEMTPYGVSRFHADGVRFANEGFIYVGVDCRGHGDSGGEFAPAVNEARDLHDTLDWLTSQPWCDGQVGLFGGSYSGMNQWCAYGTLHPALKTIVPSAAAMFGRALPSGGVGAPYIQRWGVLTAKKASYFDWFSDIGYWHHVWAEYYRHHRSHQSLPEDEFGQEMKWSAPFLEDPRWGPIWEAFVPTADAYARSTVRVLSLTGQYDSCAVAALHQHARLEELGSEAARANNYLVIGPWDHESVNDGGDRVGNLRFGSQCKIDIMGLKLDWYRWVMKGGERPEFLRDRVVYYVSGEECWRHCGRLSDVSENTRAELLVATAGVNDIFHSGWLGIDAPPSSPYQFVCDPFDEKMLDIELTPRLDAVAGFSVAGGSGQQRPYNSLFMTLAGDEPTSQAFATHLRGQGLVYHSQPLDAPLALAGRPRLDLQCMLDGPDTDLAVLLYEVRADGSAIFLSSDLLRLRYREGLGAPVLAQVGVPIQVCFEEFRFFARTLKEGSRLRLVVRYPGSLSFQKNLNSGKPVHTETPADARRLKVTVFHEGEHRSCLTLPLARDNPIFVARVRV